jgi:hypothetical protein
MDPIRLGRGKNKRLRSLAALLCTAVLLGTLTGCGPDTTGTDRTKPEPMDYGPLLTGDLQTVVSLAGMTLSVDPTTGEFIVEDGTGGIFRSNPVDRAADKKARDIWKTNLNSQFILTYSNADGRIFQEVNSFVGCVKKSGLKVHKTDDGFVSEYTFEKEGFVVPIRIALTEKGLTATVLADRIDTSASDFFVTAIDLLPFFGAAGPDKEGYMVVPDGTGGLIDLNNGKAVTGNYQANVYGDDLAIQPEQRFATQKTASLPVFGIKTQDSGLVAIITEGDAIARIEANVSGGRTSYNFLFAGFTLRQTDSFTIFDRSGKPRDFPVLDKAALTYKNLQVLYCFLGPTDNGYVRMADVYRAYLAATEGLTPDGLEPDGGLFLDFYGAVMKTKPILGLPVNTMVPLSPFHDVVDAVKALETKGVDAFVLRMVNATDADTKMKAPKNPSPSARLGGVSGYRELQQLVGEGNVYLTVDPVQVRTNGWILKTINTTSQTVLGLPAYMRRYDLTSGVRDESDRWYLLSPLVAAETFTSYAARAVRSAVTSHVAVSGFGSSLYSDFGKATVNREMARDAFATSLFAAKAAGAGILLEGSNAYTVGSAERLTDIPSTTSGYGLFDAEIPFVQMVLDGLVEYAGEPINLSSNPRRSFLKAIESGSQLHYAFITGDPSELRDTELQWLFGSDWKGWADLVAADYARYAEVAAATNGTRIVGHEILAEDFSKVTYANGAVVLVNCSRITQYEGGSPVEPMDFRIEAGER